jgi:hypothetical protein
LPQAPPEAPCESRKQYRGTAARVIETGIAADPRSPAGLEVATAKALALEIARCPLLEPALEQPQRPCHDIVKSQHVAPPAHQVPEAWAGALLTARIVFVSSNPSIYVPKPGSNPLTAEAYPTGASNDDTIAEFMLRRFDPTVKQPPCWTTCAAMTHSDERLLTS